MPKLRLAVILPIFMLCAAFPVGRWQRHLDAHLLPKREYPVVSNVTSLYHGLNAPAILFEWLCQAALPADRVNHPPLSIFGIDGGQLLFFSGVVILWFGVGLFFDDRQQHRIHLRTEMSLWQILRNLLLMVFAILLFYGGIFAIRAQHTPVGDFLNGILWLGWSLLFALPSALKLWTRFRPT
jgi:hypothetical protein